MKDYAKIIVPPSKSTRFGGKITTIIIIALIGLIILFFYFKQYQLHHHSTKNSKIVVANTTTTKATAKQLDQKTEYDFYALLPKITVPVPDYNKEIDHLQPHSIYTLQIAAVHRKKDALRLQKKLIQLGHQARIEPYQNISHTWYRIIVGPFNDKNLAIIEQNKLALQRYNSLLLTINNR